MKWHEPTEEQKAAWAEWLAERPEHVRLVAERFDPWTLYRLTTTGQRCSVIGFSEVDVDKERIRQASNPDGCGVALVPVTARVNAEHPALGEISAVEVFGINPAELVEWTESDEPDHAPVTGSIYGYWIGPETAE